MPKVHKIEIGRSVYAKPGQMGVMYLNDRRIAGGKPWGGFIAEHTYKISDADLREAMRQAGTAD